MDGWAAVDLFCSIGGLSYGLRRAGLQVVAGLDADKTCQYAFETNTGATFLGNRLEEVSATDIRAVFPEGARRGWSAVLHAPPSRHTLLVLTCSAPRRASPYRAAGSR